MTATNFDRITAAFDEGSRVRVADQEGRFGTVVAVTPIDVVVHFDRKHPVPFTAARCETRLRIVRIIEEVSS
jgi:hypothetical protein